MKKIKIASFFMVFVFLIMFLINVKAEDGDMITITTVSTHGTVNFIDVGNVTQVRKGDRLRFKVIPESGYRLKEITANDGNPISIIEDGRQDAIIDFDSYMQDFELRTGNNNLTLTVTYEQLEPFDIRYAIIPENAESQSDLIFIDYIAGYRDGDIVLPDVCSNGKTDCALEFKTSTTNYQAIKTRNDAHNADLFEHDRLPVFFVNSSAARVGDEQHPEDTIESECNINDNTCDNSIFERTEGSDTYKYIIVRKRFNEVAVTGLTIGDRKVKIYSDNFLGFDVSTNIQNFNDTLMETNSNKLSFTSGNDYKRDAEIFYGTEIFYLSKITLKDLIKTSGTMNILKYDIEKMVKKSGNYNLHWDDEKKTAEITFPNTYDMNALLDLKLSDLHNTWSKDVQINLSKYAFTGNAGQLNGFESEYWSTQYRGITNIFYSGLLGEELQNKRICEIMKNFDGQINFNTSENQNINVLERNTNFTPFAQAIFYDENSQIVGTKSFDLNSLVKIEGYTNVKYNNVDADLFYYRNGAEKPIKDIKYFNDGAQNIMYDLNIIKKTDAENLGVKTISLFLTNGPLQNDKDLPELTYGVGKGRNFIIPTEDFGEVR